ncbi:MAG: hypothetical protein Q4P23_03455, partial [Micrococcaceae bacterium]|nr:hypothetical protein [Micrococcaceae bacterium]
MAFSMPGGTVPGPFPFSQIFAADPNNTANVAKGGSVLIFAPGDAAKTPLALTTESGLPLANPVPVNANGWGPSFLHATLPQVAWEGGGFKGTFESYQGMKDAADEAATAARDSANSASNAAANAAGAVAEHLAATVAEAEAAKVAAQAAAGLVGAPAGAAVLAAIGPGGAAEATLNTAIESANEVQVPPLVAQAIAADGTVAEAAATAVDAALLLKQSAYRTIICRGDSITAGAKGAGVSYPMELSKLVPGIPVISRGFPGEKTQDIAKRQGSAPMMVTVTGGVLPATLAAIPVTLNASIYIGADADNGNGDGQGLFGTINGVRGELRGNISSGFNFYRTVTGAAFNVPTAVPWVDEFETRNRDANQIIMTGRNNMNVGYADVVPFNRKMADYQTAGDYLVLSITTRVDETSGTDGYNKVVIKNAELATEFGAHYFDLRRWLITNGLS